MNRRCSNDVTHCHSMSHGVSRCITVSHNVHIFILDVTYVLKRCIYNKLSNNNLRSYIFLTDNMSRFIAESVAR